MHYVLHIVAGSHVVTEDFGPPHRSLPAARSEAVKSAQELTADWLRQGQQIWPDSCIEIHDETGRIADVVWFKEAVFGAGLKSPHFGLYKSVYHPYLILTPDLDILEANPAYLNATMTDLAQIRHRAIFDVFPDNPGDPQATGVKNLRTSLLAVLREKRPHGIWRQRYDIRRRDGTWEERHWVPNNFPVLDDNGEVAFIVHHAEDVTAQVTRP